MNRDMPKLSYPPVKRLDKTVTFQHGGQFTDSYEWLEKLNSQEVRDFLKSQNEVAVEYIEKCKDLDKFHDDLRYLCVHTKISCPIECAKTHELFYFINDETGVSDSLYVQKGVSAKPVLLLSPNDIPTVSKHSSSYFIRMFAVSYDGQILAYAFGGRESLWLTIGFMDIESREDLGEVLTNVRLSDLCWTRDRKGILYSCCNNKNPIDHKIAFHRLGTDQLDDVVLVEFPNKPNMTLQAQLSDCGEIIFVTGQSNDSPESTHFFYGDFNFSVEDDYKSTPLLFHLMQGIGLEMQYITNEDNIVYFRTNHRAPNFRIVTINLSTYDRTVKHKWGTIIHEDSERFLDWAVRVNKNYLMVCYLKCSSHKLELHQLEDGILLKSYSLPIGTITEYFGSRDTSRFYFTFTSFLVPDSVRYIEISEKCRSWQFLNPWGYRRIRHFNNDPNTDFPSDKYCVKQLFCVNLSDNTSIPIFVIHKKKLKLNGDSPCLIYGQGCFALKTMPSFSVSKWTFLQYFDGVVAIVSVRGGGEYGDRWYQDGCRLNKQNTYEDFLTASEYLIKMGYTSPSKLIIEGGYYGGNLAAVCLTQRPELYSAAIIRDGLMDMLRFHIFDESQDYLQELGNPEAEDIFDILRHNSPMQNVFLKNGEFPCVMAVLGHKGTLSHPSNSYKFVAEVQNRIASDTNSNCNMPCILLSHAKTNFGAGDASKLRKDLSYAITERAYIFAFLMQSLNLKLTDFETARLKPDLKITND